MSLLPPRVARRATAAAVVALLLAGCGTASPLSPPTGVDQLAVPTPAPEADDFVAELDNPWLALERGTTIDLASSTGGEVTVQVAADTVPVAGLDATAVRRTGAGLAPHTDYLAQDVDGNVWWVGRQGVWEAGVDGARAGLVMPARPRVGDGWAQAHLADVVEDRAEVVSVGEPLALEGREHAETVVLEVTDPLTGKVRRRTYARGTGLVLDQPVTAGSVPDPLGTLVRQG
ncbi:hypothetical protein [Nocardioides ferulae]|uniref:hypothetical protein n=1 Tax=Nocardioides ferulae TaxID=2340821 RepID=UPI000F86AEDF|nr:hypothetical protein [Nocardioides ferulae]